MAKKYVPQFELGSGAFGRAVVVKHKESSRTYVAKIIQVRNLSEVELERCVTEVTVMASCNHRNIIQYLEAFVDKACLHIIMQYAQGGDLHNKIENQRGVYFSREVILDWFIQIILALEYIHSKGILHRDLKPQNVFLTKDGTVKLGDFGIAKILSHGDDLASTRIGTPFYISPEICAGKQYNSSSDMWAAGCMLFELTLLRVPFNAASLSALTKHIIQCQFDHIPRSFGHVIPSMISQLLVFEPEQRFTASQILQHPELSDIVKAHSKLNLDHVKVNRSRSDKKVKNDSRSKEKTIGVTNEDRNEEENVKKANIDNLGSVNRIENTNCCDKQGLPETVTEDTTEGVLTNKPVEDVDCAGQDQQCPIQTDTTISHVADRLEKRSRSYSLKESVIRKLSAASPKLAETVRLQRMSINENKLTKNQSIPDGNGVAVDVTSDANDDVFGQVLSTNDNKGARNHRGSLTYTVLKPYKNVDDTQKNDENNNSPVAADINSCLILALSMSRSNIDLAKTILTDKLAYSVGPRRSDALLAAVKQLVIEQGQSYDKLKDVFLEGEEIYIPLISMLLCL